VVEQRLLAGSLINECFHRNASVGAVNRSRGPIVSIHGDRRTVVTINRVVDPALLARKNLDAVWGTRDCLSCSGAFSKAGEFRARPIGLGILFAGVCVERAEFPPAAGAQRRCRALPE